MIDSQERITALYCRYSGEEDINGNGSNSINNQKLLLKSYALEHDFYPVQVYVDDGFSGTKFDRPDFQRMIQDIENGTVGTVIVKDMSRLGRNHITVGYYTEEFFLKHKIRFIAVCDGVDSAVSTDEMGPFRNIVNEMYARDISKKTRASVYARGKSGKRMIAAPIYGYKYDEEKEWIIDEPAAAVVRRIFNMYLSGIGMTSIAKKLSEEGIPKPHTYKTGAYDKGHSKYPDWSMQSVKVILKRQEYVGDTINFKTLRPSYKSNQRTIRPKSENMIFPNTHPAIISRSVFEEAQVLMSKKMRQYKREWLVPESLFHGILICPECGCKFAGYHVKRNYGIYTNYVCATYRRFKSKQCTSHAINEKTLIELVVAAIEDLLTSYRTGALSKKLRKVFQEDTIQKQEAADKELTLIQQQLEECENTIKSLYKDKLSGAFPNDVFLQMHSSFMREKQKLEAKQYELMDTINSSNDRTEVIGKFLKIMDRYSDPNTPFTLDRKSLIDIVDHIVVSEEKEEGANHRHIDIYFKYVGMLH